MIRRSSERCVAPTPLRVRRSNALRCPMPAARRTTRPPSYAPSRPRACVSARKARAPCWPLPTQAAAHVENKACVAEAGRSLRQPGARSGAERGPPESLLAKICSSEPPSFPRRPQPIPRRVPAPLCPDTGDAGDGDERRVRPRLTDRPRPTRRLRWRRSPGRGARCWRGWRPRCGAGRSRTGSGSREGDEGRTLRVGTRLSRGTF